MSFKVTCSRRFRTSLISFSSTPPITESARRIGWKSQTDENYDTLKRFLADVKRCLAVGGVVMLGFYKAHEPLLRAELQRAGLQVVSVREERRWGYDANISC
jgi:hypothetical protein